MLPPLLPRHGINIIYFMKPHWAQWIHTSQKKKKKSVRHHQNELRFFMLRILNTVSVFIKPSMCNLHSTCWKLHQGHRMPLRIHFLYGLGMRMRAIPPAPTVWVALCNELSLLPTDLMSLWKYITWIPFPTPSLSSAQHCVLLNR